MDELKSCPFCGGEAKVVDHGGFFTVGCTNLDCAATIDLLEPSEESAAADWNRRAEPENKPLTYSIEFTQDEISEFRHYLNPVKNNQSLDLSIRMTAFELLHKFPDNSYAHKPEQEEK